MHSVCISSQLLVLVLFIAVLTNNETFKFYLTLVMCILPGLCIMKGSGDPRPANQVFLFDSIKSLYL